MNNNLPKVASEKDKYENLERHRDSSDVSRRLFLRTVGIGATGIVLSKIGLSNPGGGLHTFAPFAAQKRYYGHDAVLDQYGVIAPWYKQLNGQCDLRVRIAAETMKRYPWTTEMEAVDVYPGYVFSGKWRIDPDGKIAFIKTSDYQNGDVGQRSACVLKGMVEYYKYSGDPAAIAHLTYMGNYVLDHILTPENHPWPKFPISVPIKGVSLGKANPDGIIQLDISASIGEGLLRAYQITGNERWFDAAKHWGDLFAEKCNLDPGAIPWKRYANVEDVSYIIDHAIQKSTDPRTDKQTGGVTMVLGFLDELIRLGYNGEKIIAARDAGRKYLADVLLPNWTNDETWGHYFWDWLNATQNCSTTADVSAYMMKNKDAFPNWRKDVRNILTLFLNRSGVDPISGGDVYNGAWAYPESSICCGESLWYAPLMDGSVTAQYGVESGSVWARELGYRQMVLQTYDVHETGVTEDNIHGGVIVNGGWFNIAHPLPLLHVLNAISWLPEEIGASRENHLVRSNAVIKHIVYDKGLINYTTFDAPIKTIDVLRLSFIPQVITANGNPLHLRQDLNSNGYTLKKLPNGDVIAHVRHDGAKDISIKGNDPQKIVNPAAIQYSGKWVSASGSHFTEAKGAAATITFQGNQVRISGKADTFGGLADVYIDGEKQLVPIDCWNPTVRDKQILYYKNGLKIGTHTLKIVARGEQSHYAKGAKIYISSVQFSAENRSFSYKAGTGPTETQRMIFGYTKRSDYKDTNGHLWRPATEIITRLGKFGDSVKSCWWTDEVEKVTGAQDPELYAYGYHAKEFWVNITVGPGNYDLKLMFASTRDVDQARYTFDILINGIKFLHKFNIKTAAGGKNKASIQFFKDIKPVNGIIEVRLKASVSQKDGEAAIHALEVGKNLTK